MIWAILPESILFYITGWLVTGRVMVRSMPHPETDDAVIAMIIALFFWWVLMVMYPPYLFISKPVRQAEIENERKRREYDRKIYADIYGVESERKRGGFVR